MLAVHQKVFYDIRVVDSVAAAEDDSVTSVACGVLRLEGVSARSSAPPGSIANRFERSEESMEEASADIGELPAAASAGGASARSG